MSILSQLEQNKGTVSSALGKALAKKVLAGQIEILDEAVRLLQHDEKNVRAGSAKVIEQVAVANPELVVGHLPQLLPALQVDEPQTRWMAIHTLGLCAALDTPTALQALPKAEAFIRAESGACLWGATIKYLGHVGATSPANVQRVFPLLEHALQTIPKQAKQVLAAFLRMLHQTEGPTRDRVVSYAHTYAEDVRPSVSREARKIQRRVGLT